jgi:hypothetical protein
MAKRKKAGRGRKRKTGPNASTRSVGLSGLNTVEMAHELRRRRAGIGKLQRKRDHLINRIAEIDAVLVREGAGLRGGQRHRNESKLADALAAMLRNNPMSVTDAAEKVQATGYRTTSPNFRTIVNQTLITDKRFKRVSRGVYRA